MFFEIPTPWFLEVHEVIDALECKIYSILIFKANLSTGLSSAETKRRVLTHGKNELPQQAGTSFVKLVLKQFEDLLVIILLLAAFVSFILALFEDEDRVTAFVEPIVILLILIANATVGVIQENDAESAINELKRYEALSSVVLRDGMEQQVSASSLVPGDIVILKVGDKIPADCRLVAIHSSILSVDQSILTGESDSVHKKTEKVKAENFVSKNWSFRTNITEETLPSLADPVRFTGDLIVNQDKTNMLFSGTLITSGRAVAIVTATGSTTAIGKIHSSISDTEDEKTPLKQQLDVFGEQLSKLIGAICLAVWMINIGHFSDPAHGGLFKGAIYYFKIAVALAVAAVPEGLPAVVTTCLALGTRQMAKEGAIVRSLPSVETLGCTTAICVDKTGTLTTNQMCVKSLFIWKKKEKSIAPVELAVDGEDYTPFGELTPAQNETYSKKSLLDLAACASICNDSKIEYSAKDRRFTRIGEPTEAALQVLVEKIGTTPASESVSSTELQNLLRMGASKELISSKANHCGQYWARLYEKLNTLEFTRKRKSMGVICLSKQTNERILFVKGAPEKLLQRCSTIEMDSGEIIELNDEIKAVVADKINELGSRAYRCLALTKGAAPSENQTVLDVNNSEHFEAIEQRLTLIGIVGMVDPVRPAVKDAVKACKAAGIRVIVLTGDNHNTAAAVCHKLGILEKYETDTLLEELEGQAFHQYNKTMSGSDWSYLSPAEKDEVAKSVVLLSRVEPIHKFEIVKKLKEAGETLAFIGDGVNDAPALKKADIGVAMGSGTAVAKEASDLILLDDNFGTIVSAVKYGRSIYTNTKQFIRYLISSNIGEVCCIFFAAALGIPEALTPVQLLWVNFVTDGLPATALSFNKPEKDSMKKPPRRREDGLVDSFTFFRYAVVGIYVGVAVVLGFLWWFMIFENGPQLTFSQLTSFQHCALEEERVNLDFDCSTFTDAEKFRYPSTVALSILVTIEMLNALNSISETQSLTVITPFSNYLLIGAIALSFALHFCILYIRWLSDIFGVAPLSYSEWYAVISFSAPVIVIDELIKFYARNESLVSGLSSLKSMKLSEKLSKQR